MPSSKDMSETFCHLGPRGSGVSFEMVAHRAGLSGNGATAEVIYMASVSQTVAAIREALKQ
jgi:hypothetical protein